MLALCKGMDAMERQTVRATPHHDITVHQWNAPNLLGALLAAPEEDRRQAQRYGHDRLIKVTVARQTFPISGGSPLGGARQRSLSVAQAGNGRQNPVQQHSEVEA
jgi:hypothetical protein